MPTQIQLRRGTTAENAAFTGAEGELTVDTQTNSLIVHDGSTVGGNATGGGSVLTTKGDVATFSTVDARLPVGTNDQVLTADSAEATGVKWATPSAGGAALDLVEVANGSDYLRFGHNVADIAGSTSTQGTANKATYFPMWFLTPVTVTSLGCQFGTADAGSTDTRAAIYSQHATTAYPDTLLASTGHLDTSVVGRSTETLGTPVVLPAGCYWFGIKSDSTTLGMTELSVTATWGNPLGISRSGARPRYPYHTNMGGAWPATAATPAGTDSVNTTKTCGFI